MVLMFAVSALLLMGLVLAAPSTNNDTVLDDGRGLKSPLKARNVRIPRSSNMEWHDNLASHGDSRTSFQEDTGNHHDQSYRNSKSSHGASSDDAFRSYDGHGNNGFNVMWGAANTKIERLLPAKYSDGVEQLRTSVNGNSLPSARLVSTSLFESYGDEDPNVTLLSVQWGQLNAHDMAAIAGTTQTRWPFTDCCAETGGSPVPTQVGDKSCLPIAIPSDDPVYSAHGRTCMNFVRSGAASGASPGEPADQSTSVSHFMDASFVYGSSQEKADSLRDLSGGRMRMEYKDGRMFLPSASNKSAACAIEDESEACYVGGDSRVNQNPNLAVLQTVFLREHNRIAKELENFNPDWNDETIFQEARRIVIAEYQHITYHEYLPNIIGTKAWSKLNSGYDESVNPSIMNSFVTAAFRHQHSNIVGMLRLFDEQHDSMDELRMSDHFGRPDVIEHGCVFDGLLRGMTTQPQEKSDQTYTTEILYNLFRSGAIGQDLLAIDIHRGRDHGLPSYNEYREVVGLSRATEFEDFAHTISEENIRNMAHLYEHPDDVDLMVGGMLEHPVDGATTGPTFLWITVDQFYRTRAGDRYFYDNVHQPYPFNSCQLDEIRKATVSRLFCDNSDLVSEMQPKGFCQKSHDNHVVPCHLLPAVDLRMWKEGRCCDCSDALQHENSARECVD